MTNHQEIRFENPLDLEAKHPQAILSGSRPSGYLCLASVEENTSKGKGKQALSEGLKLEADLSDNNSNSGAVTENTFPTGVPIPQVRNFAVEFECNLCFRAKKFQRPLFPRYYHISISKVIIDPIVINISRTNLKYL